MGHFPAQDGLFAGRTVTVIPKMAGFLQHAVAGDEIGQRVVGDGIPDRAGGPGRMNLFCQGLVGGQSAQAAGAGALPRP